jgi:hypothetical protein
LKTFIKLRDRGFNDLNERFVGERGKMMKAVSISTSIGLAFLLICTGIASGGEFSYELKGCGTSERSIIDKAGDLVIGRSLARGVTESVPPGGPFDKMIYECGALWQISKTGFEFTQKCTFIDADGDKTLGTANGTSKGWDWKFLSGTGKWEGISGGGPSTMTGQYGKLPAVSGGCWSGKGMYSLP